MTCCKFFIFLCLLTIHTFCVNADENNKVENEATNKPESPTVLKPLIKYIHYNSTISNRYAVTKVSSNVANRANVSQEVHFSLVLPETAFISEFLMIIKDKEYKAYVKEKEEAKQVYDAAVAAGQTAAHVEQSVRDSNRFQVSVNVEAEGKITFVLTYEELLSRSLGVYTHTVNVNPGQIVKDLQVEVHIQEPVDITLLKVPNFKTKNEIGTDDEQDNPLAVIKRDPSNKKNATVFWAPSVEEQMKIEKDGLKGQLVVKYDVDRSKSSQILLDEGYFVHFFTPDSAAPPLAKHVVFVLDISGSMHGRKIEQLREAMVKILDDLHEQDYFSIILFSSDVIVWSPLKTQHLFKEEYAAYNFNDEEVVSLIKRRDQNEILTATKDNVNKAKEFINKIRATDATNIMGGLREGLNVSSEGQTKFLTESNSGLTPQPLIVFLTDGDPNVDISDPNEIVNVTYNLNEIKCPIYSLAFGDGADLQFLRRLSLKNYGFGRNIYEASDAAIQLNNFYQEISSPLMSDVTFDYLPGQVENGTLTRTSFPVFFLGNEFIIAGKLADPSSTKLDYTVNANKSSDSTKNYNPDGGFCVIFPPTEIRPPKEANHTLGHLEKLWAFLTIRQLLDKDSTAGSSNSNDTSPEKKEALKLALKYSFVTPLTSLVVVKPNETQSVEPEKASNNDNRFGAGGFGYGVPLSIMAARPQAGFPGSPVVVKSFFNSLPLKRGAQFAKRFGNSKSRQFSFRKSVPLSQHFGYDVTDDKVYRINKVHDHITVGASYASFAAGFGGGIPISGPPPPYTPVPFAAQEPMLSTPLMPVFDNIPVKSEPSKVPLDSLKWLPSHGNDEEFIIDVPSLGNYTVGSNLTDVPLVDGCKVGNETTTYSYNGTCHHLKYCALSTFIDSVEQYVSYFCAMANNYAGVCCPF